MGYIWSAVCIAVAPLVFVYVVIPCILLLFPSLHNTVLFFAVARWPFNDYADLKGNGVATRGRNFQLHNPEGGLLGVWQILAGSVDEEVSRSGVLPTTEADWEEMLGREGGPPTIIYLHGNGATRVLYHRVEHYNFFAAQDYNVVTLDYRGFGDSPGSPTEKGVISDAKFIYKWVRERAKGNPVFLWGHSLGTAIGTQATIELCSEGVAPPGLILESPFNNLDEVVKHHPFTIAYRWLPPDWLHYLFLRPFREHHSIHMNTDERLPRLTLPVLILHAMDDFTVPFHLAKKLVQVGREAGVDLEFVEFDHPHNYGHKFIHRAPELPDVVRKFATKCLSKL